MQSRNKVDIVVGGQYGDEGKGAITSLLAQQVRYDYAIRVGGDNAEHRFHFKGKAYTGRAVPVAWISPTTLLLLGPGMIFGKERFWLEVNDIEKRSGLSIRNRISIDPQAALVRSEDIVCGKEAAKMRGSTYRGVGVTASRKVLRDGTCLLANADESLKQAGLIRSTRGVLRPFRQRGGLGLLEGSQGVLLSLNHGFYPYCTSKDVTPAGLLAEAGLTPSEVRYIIMVVRTISLRVPGSSGPTLGREISWEELEKRLGCTIPLEYKIQTNSKKIERISEWSWEELQWALELVNPTHIAVTFTDYLNRKHRGVQHWEKLNPKTKQFIMKLRDWSGIPVVLIRTGPNENDVILLPEFNQLKKGIDRVRNQ